MTETPSLQGATDDAEEFERLGRRAGAELRQPPPAGGPDAIETSASRRRIVTAVARGAIVAAVLGGIVLFARDDEPEEQVPATSVPAPTTAAPPLAGTSIAYQASAGGVSRILVFDPASGDRSTPTGDVQGGDQVNPDWSPDGRRLVLGSVDGERDDLWLTNVDDSGSDLLLDCVDDCLSLDDPAWSPDGGSVIYARLTQTSTGAVATLERVHLDDGTIDVLLTAQPQTFYAGPQWSPDGASVVLEIAELTPDSVNAESPDAELVGVTLAVVDLTASPPTIEPLTDPALFAETADWSPDGSLIVYSALVEPRGDARDVFTIEPDGTNVTQVTRLSEDGGLATHPAFMPDGREIILAAQLEPGAETVIASTTLGDGSIRPALGPEYQFGEHPRPEPGS